MFRLFRLLWKLFILACVFGIGYIIGKEHSFEEEEEWEKEEEKLKEEQEKCKDDSTQDSNTTTTSSTNAFGSQTINAEQTSNNTQSSITNQSSANQASQTSNLASTDIPSLDTKPVEFKYTNPEAKHVSIVGDFNDWNKDKNPLQLIDGVWKTTINLKPGKYEYKFVINHTDWIPDPENNEKIADKYGGYSSVIYVN